MVDKSATAQLDAATEPFRRSDLALARFAEFQRLWAEYRATRREYDEGEAVSYLQGNAATRCDSRPRMDRGVSVHDED